MADSVLQQQRCVSLKQLVKIGDQSIVELNTHILPTTRSVGTEEESHSPYAWFSDLVNQELLVCAHDLLLTKATDNIEGRSDGVSDRKAKSESSGLNFEFRKSSGFRGLFIFKPSTLRYQLLLPSQSTPNAPSSVCAFINEYGRRVLPFFTSPSKGQGYRPFRVLPECLHAYVDCCEAHSSLGIFKVLRTLDPKHRLSMDIASYFRPRETEQPNGGEEESFPEVPVAGLRRRSKRKIQATKTSKQKSSKSKNSKAAAVPPNQPLIEQALRGTGTAAVYTETDLPVDVIDGLLDFDSQPVTNKGDDPVISGDSDDCNDNTPPIDEQLPPRKKFVSEGLSGVGVVREGQTLAKPRRLTGEQHSSVSDVIRSSGARDVSLTLKKETPPIEPPPLKDATPTSNQGEVTGELTDLEFMSTDEDCLFGTPPTPTVHLNPGSTRSESPPVVEQGVEDVCKDGVGGSVCAGGVGGDGRRGSPHPSLIVLDDVTNTSSKSPTPISSSSSADSATCGPFTENLEEDCIQVSSEEDVMCTRSERGLRRRRGKPQQLSLDQIMDGVKRVSDLTRNKIIQWMRLRRPVILNVFKGKLFSQRHKDYLTSGKKRAALVHCVDTSMFTAEGLDTLHTNLLKMFCAEHMKYFDYVMSVLVPECVVRIIADINRVSFEEGERLMYSYDSINLSQDSDD